MTLLPPDAEAALDPVRAQLIGDARREADRLIGDARREAQARLEQARREAEATVQQAREAGAAQAAQSVAREVARARREARGVVLATQEVLRQRVRAAVRSAAGALRAEAGYPDLLAALGSSARAVLGDGAVVREAPDGGVLADRGSLRVDLSLPVLADRALNERAGEVAVLWTR
jgi:vacuolar-type H+-ATPase subunit E/Vma4